MLTTTIQASSGLQCPHTQRGRYGRFRVGQHAGSKQRIPRRLFLRSHSAHISSLIVHYRPLSRYVASHASGDGTVGFSRHQKGPRRSSSQLDCNDQLQPAHLFLGWFLPNPPATVWQSRHMTSDVVRTYGRFCLASRTASRRVISLLYGALWPA